MLHWCASVHFKFHSRWFDQTKLRRSRTLTSGVSKITLSRVHSRCLQPPLDFLFSTQTSLTAPLPLLAHSPPPSVTTSRTTCTPASIIHNLYYFIGLPFARPGQNGIYDLFLPLYSMVIWNKVYNVVDIPKAGIDLANDGISWPRSPRTCLALATYSRGDQGRI